MKKIVAIYMTPPDALNSRITRTTSRKVDPVCTAVASLNVIRLPPPKDCFSTIKRNQISDDH